MSERLTCPYCNAFVPVSENIQKGQRLPCPQCEETFTVQHVPEGIQTSTSPESTLSGTVPLTRGPDVVLKRPGNRKVLLIVLAVMLTMAGIGLAAMLMTVDQRRKNDTGIVRNRSGRKAIPDNPKAGKPPKIQVRAPLELEGLRYLPRDTQLVIGIHVGELLQLPEGKKLLEQGLQLDRFRLPLRQVESLLNVKLEEFDHVLIAVRDIDRQLIPPIHIIALARAPFNQEGIKEHLQAKALSGSARPIVYSFPRKLLTTHVNGRLTFPNAHTAVLGWNLGTDPSPIRIQAGKGETYLSEAITSLMKGSVKAPAPLWIAAHSDKWDQAVGRALELIVKVDSKYLDMLAKLQTFVVWIQRDESLLARGLIRCPDESSAKSLVEVIPQLPALVRSQLRIFRNGEAISLQYRPPKSLP